MTAAGRQRASVPALLAHLATRPGHDEVKAGFRQLLLDEFGADLSDIRFEARVPEVRGRLDALVGRTVFEAKSDLNREWPDVERRMPDYLRDRERAEGDRYVGIASDGLRWRVLRLEQDRLTVVRETVLDPDRPEPFLAFLDGALALKSSLPPDPLTVRIELGGDSPAYARARDGLDELWDELKADPAVALKRQLWSQLLTLVYGRRIESDALWFQHSFLVIVAKCIAFAVTGLRNDDPAEMMSGRAFADASIFGAVESDFFDWVLASPKGEALVRRIMNHVRRFRLDAVESDVLKVLYESLIDRAERHGLGEYYTPDWLAAKVVAHTVADPLQARVLDPACGSGTFLFHAVRRFLGEAGDAGLPDADHAADCTQHVAGLDIHPVAVIIARVTYLLALARGGALAKRAGTVTIPVYLGDAMQLSVRRFITRHELAVEVPAPPGSGAGPTFLEFPEVFCRDPGLFDNGVNAMRDASEQGFDRAQFERNLTRIVEQHYKADVTAPQAEGVSDFGAVFLDFDALRRAGRDSVWAYVARNLSRPLFLSAANGWATVLVGNPPWVAFRHMTPELQRRFRELAKGERVYVGGKMATQNDLAALFVVRATGLYLKPGGRLGFVMPYAAMRGGQFEKFRSGSFHSTRIRWEEAWTMDDTVQPLFPVPSSVVFGRRRGVGRRMPDRVRRYSGTLPFRDAPEEVADARLTVEEGAEAPKTAIFAGGSGYRQAFRQGATLVPRFLCLVERKPVGRMGGDPSRPLVVSRRTTQEKRPWKDLPAIEQAVEAQFLRPVYLGESILPFRVHRPFEGVVPVNEKGRMLDAGGAADAGWPGLHGWMKAAEAAWEANRRNDVSFSGWLDYYGKLSCQFPVAPVRVAFSASGTIPAAVLLRDNSSVIEHGIYWHAPNSEAEGHYLAAILGSEAARARVAALQARGQWGARHFDKVMFNLPIPPFDPADALHGELAAAGAGAETAAAAVAIAEGTQFQRARRLVREALSDHGVAPRIDALVGRLLDRAPARRPRQPA